MTINRTTVALTLLVFVLLPLGGCSSYVMHGRVVEGDYAVITVVSEDDSRFDRPGIEGASLTLYRDPTTLGKKLAGKGVSGPDGWVTMEVAGFGVGFLDEQWLLQVYRSGFQSQEDLVRLPSSKKMRILVMLPVGKSVKPPPMEDLYTLPEKYR
jgi:hypothetical protein